MTAIDEPWHRNLIEHHRVQREKGAPRAVEGSTITREPIDGRRAVRWAGDMTKDDYLALQRTAGLADFFGYQPDDPTPCQQLTPSETSRKWVADGDDLSRRRLDWEGRVDFDQQTSTPVIDARPEELAARLAGVEQALVRVRSRRAVRLVDAFRKVQKGRSVRDVRAAWSILRNPHGVPDPDSRSGERDRLA